MVDPTAWINEAIAAKWWGEPGTYTVEIQDMQAEIDARLAEKRARNILRRSLKTFKDKKKTANLTAAEVRQAMEAWLDLVDLTEESET